jgi:hypothetical protein
MVCLRVCFTPQDTQVLGNSSQSVKELAREEFPFLAAKTMNHNRANDR